MLFNDVFQQSPVHHGHFDRLSVFNTTSEIGRRNAADNPGAVNRYRPSFRQRIQAQDSPLMQLVLSANQEAV